jgi:hypothetical protein
MFETNMRVGYAVQREASLRRMEGVDYRRYICMMLPTSRDEHKAMHNTILHKDDPWWNINTPPNGWNCYCKVSGISEEEIELRGLKVSDSPTGHIASKDWAYNPSDPSQGWDNRSTPAIEQQPDYKSYGRPELKDIDDAQLPEAPELLDEGKTKEEALEIMSKAIMGNKEELVVNTQGGEVLITKDLLAHSVEKRLDKRERYANYVIPTLENPYEIYYTQYADGSRRMRYVGLYKGGKAFAAITLKRDGNILWNVMRSKPKTINQFRKGWLIYGK